MISWNRRRRFNWGIQLSWRNGAAVVLTLAAVGGMCGGFALAGEHL
jgi:hypothetical protein